MSKLSYIEVPEHETRNDASAELSSRVIANAMRLLIAVILMSALVTIIILAAHRAVEVQLIQPWTLAPAPVQVPTTVESPPPLIVERKYILCLSELSNRSSDLKWGQLSESENRAMKTALRVFKQCAVIKVQLDVGKELRQPTASTDSNHWMTRRSCHRRKDLPESKPKLVENLEIGQESVPVYSTDDELIFYGTPFLYKWHALYENEDKDEDNALDRCIRLMLVWRYGGLVCNPEEANEELLRQFQRILDTRKEPVVLITDSLLVYSKRSCHAAIGTMLLDLSARLSHQVTTAKDQETNIMEHVRQLFQGSVYFGSNRRNLPLPIEDYATPDIRHSGIQEYPIISAQRRFR